MNRTVFRSAHIALVFLFFLTFAFPTRASLASQLCNIILSRFVAGKDQTSSGKWFKDLKITSKLKTLLENHLGEIAPGAEKFLNALPKGSLLEVNGVKYKVLAYLGGEYEGAVYLTDGPEGKRSIKQFNGKTEILAHYKELERIAQMGIATPSVWAVDAIHKTAAMEYIEGVPVNVLFNKGAKNGLTQAELAAVRLRYDRFKSQVMGLGREIKDGNIIMDLNTGEFVMVDPI